jgi:CRISPR system Cascade subunit CasC
MMSEAIMLRNLLKNKLRRGGKKTIRAEVHVIQTLIAGRLNRDDTNSLKRLNVGGTERAVISSQAQKFPLRASLATVFNEMNLGQGVATREVPNVLAESLAQLRGTSADETLGVVKSVWNFVKLTSKNNTEASKDAITRYSLEEIAAIGDVIQENYTQLSAKNNSTVKNEVCGRIRAMFAERTHVDIATHLFGRMMANLPEGNIDGCVCTSYAFSTHENNVTSETYTAVDDFGEVGGGAAMVGHKEVNSATYYRYSHVDVHLLHERISEQHRNAPALTAAVTTEYLKHFTKAVPVGGQHGNAATDAPYFILVVIRTDNDARTLGAAFNQAVTDTIDVAYASVKKLHHHWKHTLRQEFDGSLHAYALEYEHDDKPIVFTYNTTQIDTLKTLLDKVNLEITNALEP